MLELNIQDVVKRCVVEKGTDRFAVDFMNSVSSPFFFSCEWALKSCSKKYAL